MRKTLTKAVLVVDPPRRAFRLVNDIAVTKLLSVDGRKREEKRGGGCSPCAAFRAGLVAPTAFAQLLSDLELPVAVLRE